MNTLSRLALGLIFVATSTLGGVALAGEEGSAGDWPHWRGPSLDGSSEATGLPTKWSESENVRFKVALPAFSASSPVIAGDRIFVATAGAPGSDPAPTKKRWRTPIAPVGKDLYILCLSTEDGRELWRTKVAGGNYLMGKHDLSSPSPITDGERVYAMTGSGIVSALDLEGKLLWQADIQKQFGRFAAGWGYGASPLLHEGRVIVPVLHGRGPSYLVAFEAKTGEIAWKVDRPTKATRESPDAYTTPVVMRYGDRTEVIVAGADVVTAHDPATGKETWRCGGLNPNNRGNYRLVASPVVIGDLVVSCGRSGPLLAVRGGGKGDVTGSNVAWRNPIAYDVPTPATDGTYLYILNDRGALSCVEVATGKSVYENQRVARGIYDASPLLADGKIYVTSEGGVTTVVKAGPRFEVLAENQLQDRYTLSSIAVSGKSLFIRTATNLYRIEGGTQEKDAGKDAEKSGASKPGRKPY